jgi:hypothetical protein
MKMEFEREQGAGGQSCDERAVARQQRAAAKPHPCRHQDGGNGRTYRRLRQWRNVMNRELDRDLIEAPRQAQPDRDRDREGIERARIC